MMLSSKQVFLSRTDTWYMFLSSSTLVLQRVIEQLLELFILIFHRRNRVFFGPDAVTERRTSGKIIKC